MALGSRKMKTEHAGAKNGGGYWGLRVEAKSASKKRRRRAGRHEAQRVVTDEEYQVAHLRLLDAGYIPGMMSRCIEWCEECRLQLACDHRDDEPTYKCMACGKVASWSRHRSG